MCESCRIVFSERLVQRPCSDKLVQITFAEKLDQRTCAKKLHRKTTYSVQQARASDLLCGHNLAILAFRVSFVLWPPAFYLLLCKNAELSLRWFSFYIFAGFLACLYYDTCCLERLFSSNCAMTCSLSETTMDAFMLHRSAYLWFCLLHRQFKSYSLCLLKQSNWCYSLRVEFKQNGGISGKGEGG